MKAEVVVIGGGLIGASIAYYLSRQGVDLILLEKRGMCLGTSGACFAGFSLQTKKPGIHLEMARLSLGELEEFEKTERELPYPLEHLQRGSMNLVETRMEEEIVDEFLSSMKKGGVEVKYLGPKEVKEQVPIVSDNIRGATFAPSDSTVNPIHLNLDFLETAKKNGAKLMLGTAATKIVLGHDRSVRYVVTNNGARIKTDIVVNAAGVEAPEIAKMIGTKVPIEPRRGQVLVTEKAPLDILKLPVRTMKYVAVKFRPQKDTEHTDDRDEKLGLSLNASQTASGNILIGATREFVGYDTHVSLEGMMAIARNIVRLLPGLQSFHIIRVFAGLRPYSPDGLPFLGYAKNIGGFISAAGHEGDGMALSPLTGRLISELVTKGKTRYPLEKMSPERFD